MPTEIKTSSKYGTTVLMKESNESNESEMTWLVSDLGPYPSVLIQAKHPATGKNMNSMGGLAWEKTARSGLLVCVLLAESMRKLVQYSPTICHGNNISFPEHHESSLL